jgi:hypothetical protein
MKRVPITQKDYPENFNNVAKYLGRNWIDQKLSFEASRQLLANAIGYNSIHELERAFLKRLPNLIDVNHLKFSIKQNLQDEYKKQSRDADVGYHLTSARWNEYEKTTFSKIPFYKLDALNESKDDVFGGVYNKVAESMSLFIQNYRYGGYYGIFLPHADSAGDIDHAIDYDKTNNLIDFFDEYECFPFGRGNSHISVITEIGERSNKWFNEDGEWKIEIWHPERNNPDEYQCETYTDVLIEILSWFKEASKGCSGSPWYVIDTKKNENHWLFKALGDAMQKLAENNYKKIPSTEKKIEEDERNTETPTYLITDEAHSLLNTTDLANLHEATSSIDTDSRTPTNKIDTAGEMIKVGSKVTTDNGIEYTVDQHCKSEKFFLFNENNLNDIIELNDYKGVLNIGDPHVITQKMSDFNT